MNIFERISGSLAASIACRLGMDDGNRDVLAYGAYSIIYAAWSILLIAAAGIALGTFVDIMVISAAASLLRRYSGGAHATSPHRCAMTGVAIFGVLSLVVEFAARQGKPALAVFLAISYFVTRYWITKYAPVDTPSKPITNEERRKRFRRMSGLVVDFSFGAMAVLVFVLDADRFAAAEEIILAVAAGLFWQAFTLTYNGNMLISFFDKILKREEGRL